MGYEEIQRHLIIIQRNTNSTRIHRANENQSELKPHFLKGIPEEEEEEDWNVEANWRERERVESSGWSGSRSECGGESKYESEISSSFLFREYQ